MARQNGEIGTNWVSDYCGTPIKAGSHIVWPVRRGSSMYLRRGHVTLVTDEGDLKVNAADHHRSSPRYKTYRTTVHTPKRCAVIGDCAAAAA